MLKACLFDLGNTLSDDTRLLAASLADVAGWLSGRGAIGETEEFVSAYTKVHESCRAPFISHTFGELIFFEEAFQRCGVRGVEPSEALAWYRGRIEERTELDPEVPAAFAWLRERGLRVGLLSNERTERVDRFLERTRLRPCLDVVVVSEAVGVQKPDGRIFSIALGRLGAAGSEAAMFGDSEVADGACRTVGMRFVLVKRFRRAGWGWDEGERFEPDLEVERVDRRELERVLPLLERGAGRG